MKLIILIIQSIDMGKINAYLSKSPYFFQKVASTGGLVNNGTVTFLIKLNDEVIDDVIKDLSALCKTRRVKINNASTELAFFSNVSSSQKVGGASFFIINLDQYLKI